jgi:hypothetical protein
MVITRDSDATLSLVVLFLRLLPPDMVTCSAADLWPGLCEEGVLVDSSDRPRLSLILPDLLGQSVTETLAVAADCLPDEASAMCDVTKSNLEDLSTTWIGCWAFLCRVVRLVKDDILLCRGVFFVFSLLKELL